MNPASFLGTDPVACIAAAILLGLVAGSFLNVVIARLPRMLEREWQWEVARRSGDTEALSHFAGLRLGLAAPPSHCPACRTPIRVIDNIPVWSFVRLRGRCRACGARIGLRYPAVELASALAAALVVWRFGCGPAAGGALMLTFALIALFVLDLETRLLPDAITLPLLWLGLLFNVFGAHATLDSAVLGAVAGYTLLWSLFHLFRALTGKEGMGYGDFKLLAMLGAWLGWELLPLVVLLSSTAGILVGGTLIALGRRDRASPIPFGPFLAGAGWIGLLFGEALIRAWQGWMAAVL